MPDQTSRVRAGIKQMGLMPNPDHPRTKVALDLACARDLRETLVEKSNAGPKHCLRVAAWAREILESTPAAALDQLAKRSGYREPEQLAGRPGHGQRSAILDRPQPGHRGWQADSKYGHLPDAPSPIPDSASPGRSKFADVADPPRTQDGGLDFERINRMHGHQPTKGPRNIMGVRG